MGDLVDLLVVTVAALATFPPSAAATAALIGLIAGRFTNVLAHRLPLMLEHSATGEAGGKAGVTGIAIENTIDLANRHSRCPSCHHRFSWWENIPIASYLVLRGRCPACGTAISPQYPLVELMCAAVAVAAVLVLGVDWRTPAAMALSFTLVALAVIDRNSLIVPDVVVLPMLWLGLCLNAFGLFTGADDAILGAVAGYLSLWLIYWLYKTATGKEGLGHGDFKLLAMLGAWLGTASVPLILILAFTSGAVFGVGLMLFAGRTPGSVVPFGPFLAGAGWIALLWGDHLNDIYRGLVPG